MIGRISRLEWAVAGVARLVLAAVTVAETDVLEAPFENARTMIFTFGGTAVAAVVLVLMLALRVPPLVRILVLGVPFALVTWWLVSPFFVDDVVDDEFSASIAAAEEAPPTTLPDADSSPAPAQQASPTTAPQPMLVGSGSIVGLAGHEGTGDAGFFAVGEASHVLRLENLDIENGPDLRLYVVPGAGQVTPGDESLYLGKLRGNVGNQTYELPQGFALSPGDWTVLVWCEAFDVEFVAATVTVS